MIVGIDFDNTLVNYDKVFFSRALDLGLIKNKTVLLKKQVRDKIRLLPDGELAWQQLQSYVYTQGMDQAHLIEGVKDFFVSCKKKNVRTYIVSHKTKHSPFADKGAHLRDIALEWMAANGFFDPGQLGLDAAQVYFESSRSEKISRIKQLGCTHFIDDLQEVFLEDSFPSGIKKILYAPGLDQAPEVDITVIESWKKIHEYFFN